MRWWYVRPSLVFGFILIGITAWVTVSCGGKATTIPPGSRLILQGNTPVYAICDRGNLLYVSESGQVQLVPLGCVTGQP